MMGHNIYFKEFGKLSPNYPFSPFLSGTLIFSYKIVYCRYVNLSSCNSAITGFFSFKTFENIRCLREQDYWDFFERITSRLIT